MRIACAQTRAELGQVTVNLDRIEHLADRAASQKADLILFPELMVSGYGPPETLTPLAAPIPGPVVERLASIARTCSLAIAVGLPELDTETGLRHNTLLLVDATGRERIRYRKVHLWDSEKKWAHPGSTFPVEPFQGLRIGATICYDVRFPEGARSLALAGAELILLATAWLGPVDEWELAARSRALDNGIYVVASALQGDPYRGSSLIIDPHGNIIARGEPGTEDILIADLDPETVHQFRTEVPLLRDRRPETYSN